MKKVVLLCIICLTAGVVQAQGIDLGLKAGANFSNISDATGLSNKTGFVFGAFAGLKLNDKIAVQADLLYSQQGAEFDGGAIDLNYVNVPIVLKYYVTENLNIHGGPQFGFIVDDNVKKVFSNLAEAESFDLTGVVGLGYDLPFGLRLAGRYNFGLSDVFKESSSNNSGSETRAASSDTGGKNAVFTLSVGYSFL
jgi:hypothetical protein